MTVTGPDPKPLVAVVNAVPTAAAVLPEKRRAGSVKERFCHACAKALTSDWAARSAFFSCSVCRHHNPAPAAPATRTATVIPPTKVRFLMTPIQHHS